ncbi:MAG: outer membrane beta-barrel protein [Deltaproteobacteria bacterium]|nr:outer membrane beta-barrel protein [Deltaproteobacteria bacterium]
MKKLFIAVAMIALAFSSVAQAELQISGNVTTMVGYQYDSANAAATNAAGGLTQGDLGEAAGAKTSHYTTIVDQAELDVENEFGENIMARIDVDFIDLGTPSASAFLLEQAYVTLNLGVGNGMEFMVGKFNAPLGLESVDRHENVFSTYTPGYIYLNPKQVMGLKFYYEFNDNWNFDLGILDSMQAVNANNSAYPSGVLRVGAKWGEESHLSYVNLGAGFGPEHNAGSSGVSQNKYYDLYGNLWGNFAAGDYWDVGFEFIYRMSQTGAAAGDSQSAMAGQLYTVYQPSDVWTIQLRAATHYEKDPDQGWGASTTGGTWGAFDGWVYSGTLGGTYQITDGAQMKIEYRFDMASASGAADANYHTGVAEFAYSF